jgi:GR25 family glycosyltransferase involved in LPS biosynthesis
MTEFINWDLLDKVLVINSLRNRERLNGIIRVFKSLNCPADKVMRIDAVWDDENRKRGKALSHIKALQFAIDNSYNTFLIVEDDIVFIKDNKYFNELLRFSNYEKQSYDVIHLSHILDDSPCNLIENLTYGKVWQSKNIMSSAAYLTNNIYAGKLIKCINEAIQHDIKMDYYWNNLQKSDKWFLYEPRIVVQVPLKSTLTEKLTHHNLDYDRKIVSYEEYNARLIAKNRVPSLDHRKVQQDYQEVSDAVNNNNNNNNVIDELIKENTNLINEEPLKKEDNIENVKIVENVDTIENIENIKNIENIEIEMNVENIETEMNVETEHNTENEENNKNEVEIIQENRIKEELAGEGKIEENIMEKSSEEENIEKSFSMSIISETEKSETTDLDIENINVSKRNRRKKKN